MKQVASTDQLGRLISLAGSAIDLVREHKRSAEQTDALLETLQTFKDPNRTPKPTIGCCKYYPHYDDPKRPNFGPNQVRYLCQLRPGLLVRRHCTADASKDTWLKKIINKFCTQEGEIHTIEFYAERITNKFGAEQYVIRVMLGTDDKNCYDSIRPLDEVSVVPYADGTWDMNNWYSFVYPQTVAHPNTHN